MTRSMVSRAASGLVLASLAVGMLAVPVSAAGVTTRWVDDDGKAGPSSCSGTKSAAKTIQKAVKAADANDVIKICPGTYVGKVTISGARKGLVLRAATSTLPVIKAVSEFSGSATTLISVQGVAGVTIRDLKLRPIRASSHSFCSWSNGIRATGATGIQVRNVDIRPTGSGPFCGVASGVILADGTTGTVRDSVIKDYREVGLQASGAGTNVTVRNVDVTFAHSGISPKPAGGAAVLVSAGARGVIRDGSLVGLAGYAAAGVRLHQAAATSVVRDMDVTTFASGIEARNVKGGTIRDNAIHGGQVGLQLLDGDGVVAYGNTSSGATLHGFYISGISGGTDAQRTTGVDVRDNDFRSSANGALHDCKGESAYVVSGSSGNAFDRNRGNSSDPASLCDLTPPVP
ncbi:MAG: right-handed parallel beta-helix repeat-containing protein [Chloroflexi bacterium]|nr:right-handed parallel beta-helix repeat-containing protein [Chloroflexota bacterium]